MTADLLFVEFVEFRGRGKSKYADDTDRLRPVNFALGGNLMTNRQPKREVPTGRMTRDDNSGEVERVLSLKERAGLLGGTISIQSEIGRGTTVTAHLPVKTRES